MNGHIRYIESITFSLAFLVQSRTAKTQEVLCEKDETHCSVDG